MVKELSFDPNIAPSSPAGSIRRMKKTDNALQVLGAQQREASREKLNLLP